MDRKIHMAIDIFVIAHGFNAVVPTLLYMYVTDYVLFKTHDNIDMVKKRIDNFDEMKAAQKRVNKHKNKYHKERIKILK